MDSRWRDALLERDRIGKLLSSRRMRRLFPVLGFRLLEGYLRNSRQRGPIRTRRFIAATLQRTLLPDEIPHLPQVGGRVDTCCVEGFRFDTGPTLLLAKDIYEETFTALGSELRNHVELRRVEPAYMCFLGDNTNAEAWSALGRGTGPPPQAP